MAGPRIAMAGAAAHRACWKSPARPRRDGRSDRVMVGRAGPATGWPVQQPPVQAQPDGAGAAATDRGLVPGAATGAGAGAGADHRRSGRWCRGSRRCDLGGGRGSADSDGRRSRCFRRGGSRDGGCGSRSSGAGTGAGIETGGGAAAGGGRLIGFLTSTVTARVRPCENFWRTCVSPPLATAAPGRAVVDRVSGLVGLVVSFCSVIRFFVLAPLRPVNRRRSNGSRASAPLRPQSVE